jgi:hypothetical protein
MRAGKGRRYSLAARKMLWKLRMAVTAQRASEVVELYQWSDSLESEGFAHMGS